MPNLTVQEKWEFEIICSSVPDKIFNLKGWRNAFIIILIIVQT